MCSSAYVFNKVSKYLCLLFFVILLYSTVSAQQPEITVKGKITTADQGTPLSGASVVIRSTKKGTTTDTDGNFTINAIKGAVLEINYVGFEQTTVRVDNTTPTIIALQASEKGMDEVLVVGYGSKTSRRDLTGSVSKVSAAEFKSAVVNTIDQALQGRTTGVLVTETSGEPGADVVVRIRGINSLSGNNQPLYVIDGFPMPPYTEAGAPGAYGSYAQNGLYGINPNDIESMEVLKDASATAIYGSRAANGVVLITTKRGKAGESQIEVVNKTTFGSISNPYEMMNTYQYAGIKNEGFLLVNQPAKFNLDSLPFRPNTNWLDAISRTGVRQEAAINFRGGSGKTNYYIAGNYLVDKGTLLGSQNNRGNVRFNLNSAVKNWYDVRLQFAGTRQKTLRGITESKGWPFAGGPLFNALRAAPLNKNDDAVNEEPDAIDGLGLGQYAFVNPVSELLDKTDITFSDQVLANIENIFYIDPKKNLEFHAVLGTSYNRSEREIVFPPWIGQGRNTNGQASQSTAKTQGFNSQLYLLHKLEKGKHSLISTVGAEYNDVVLDQFSAVGKYTDFPGIALYNLGSARNQEISSYRDEGVIQSGFIRENYSFAGKYLLTASFRADGSSKFAENEKWGYFPSIAVAWNLDQEKFMQNIKGLDFAKVRASYGLTGSQSLPAYRSLRNYSPGFYELGNGTAEPSVSLSPTQPNNGLLKWETTKQFNAGVDVGLFNNRLNVTFDYYNKLTVDLLQNSPVPSQTGYANLWNNNGSIRNKGLELGLGFTPVQTKSLKWNTRFNISRNRTIIVDLGKYDAKSQGVSSAGGNLIGGGTHILQPGSELGIFYGYQIVGLYQYSDFDATGKLTVPIPENANDNFVGRWKFADLSGADGKPDGKITDLDRVVLGNANPYAIIGWSNDVNYKSWGLSILVTSSFGNDVLNVSEQYLRTGILNLSGVSFNQTKAWYDNRWTAENQHNDIRYPAIQPQPNGGNVAFGDATSAMVQDGSYVRLKNLTISYSPKLNVNAIRDFRLFLTGTNLLTITKYTGFDPEVSSFGSDVLRPGIDYGSYPKYTSYTLGVSVTL